MQISVARREIHISRQAGLLASFIAEHGLPGFPVYSRAAPVHSDGIAPDSHRLPFLPDHNV